MSVRRTEKTHDSLSWKAEAMVLLESLASLSSAIVTAVVAGADDMPAKRGAIRSIASDSNPCLPFDLC